MMLTCHLHFCLSHSHSLNDDMHICAGMLITNGSSATPMPGICCNIPVAHLNSRLCCQMQHGAICCICSAILRCCAFSARVAWQRSAEAVVDRHPVACRCHHALVAKSRRRAATRLGSGSSSAGSCHLAGALGSWLRCHRCCSLCCCTCTTRARALTWLIVLLSLAVTWHHHCCKLDGGRPCLFVAKVQCWLWHMQ